MKRIVPVAFVLSLSLTPGSYLCAATIMEVEGNDYYSQAQSADGSFSLDYRDDIDTLWVENPDGTRTVTKTNTSQFAPHVSIEATGDGTVDFYSFEGNAGASAIIDVDNTWYTPSYDLNPMIHVWYSGYGQYGGEVVAGNNDMGSPMLPYDTGSHTGTDPILQFELPETGVYYVGVADVTAVAYSWTPTYYQRVGVKDGGAYTLHISLIPEPASLSLLALGGLAVLRRRRPKR